MQMGMSTTPIMQCNATVEPYEHVDRARLLYQSLPNVIGQDAQRMIRIDVEVEVAFEVDTARVSPAGDMLRT
jgi:hypothetical protein